MPFSFFKNRNKTLQSSSLSKEREDYVKKFAVTRSEELPPCEKFMACFEKLSRNYVLALSDPNETVKSAGVSVLEFSEGYEMRNENTDELRKSVVDLSKEAYFLTIALIGALSAWESNSSESDINDIKMEVRVISDIMLNIYKHLSMLDVAPQFEGEEIGNGKATALEILDALIESITKLNDMIDIGYINKQLESILLKLYAFKMRLEKIK